MKEWGPNESMKLREKLFKYRELTSKSSDGNLAKWFNLVKLRGNFQNLSNFSKNRPAAGESKSGFTVRQKLIGGFVSVALLLAATNAIAFYEFKETDKSYSNILNHRNVILSNAKDMKAVAAQQVSNLLMYLTSNDPNKLKVVQDENAKLNEIADQTSKLTQDKEDQEALKKLLGYNKLFKEKTDEMVKLIDTDLPSAQRLAKEQAVPLATFMINSSNEILDRQQSLMNSDSQSIHQSMRSINVLLLAISTVSFVLAIVVGIVISRMIAKPMILMAEAANRIASGDLTANQLDVRNRDEIGNLAQSFNLMARNLRNLIQQVELSAEQVAASAEQLTASAEQTSKATEQITVTVQEVASGTDRQVQSVDAAVQTIGEMYVGVQQIAANTHHVSEAATQASEKASHGRESIQVVVEQMNSIHRTVNSISDVIQRLGERSQQINKIVNAITDIASQTNLLALNAAIEAARAGEHGRGFAVVADEVRKLAEQSSQSAREIAQLVNSIQSETQTAVYSMEAGTQEVASGIKVVYTAGDSFDQILHSIQNLVGQIQEVSAAAQQMSSQTQSVVNTIKAISEVSETTAAGTQNVSAASEEQLASMEEITSSAAALSRMAEDLQSLVKQFKL